MTKDIKLGREEVQEIQSGDYPEQIKKLCADWFEFADRNEKLYLAASINYELAELHRKELDSLKQDAGAEIHDIMVRYKIRLSAADALATAVPYLLELVREHIATANDLHEVRDVDAALRKYREVRK